MKTTMNIADLIDLVRAEFTDPGTTVEFASEIEAIRIKQKTMDDPARPSKTWQPILIRLHEDFSNSEFSKRSAQELRKEFTAFIRHKRTQFNPCATDNLQQSHTPEEWIFPPQC